VSWDMQCQTKCVERPGGEHPVFGDYLHLDDRESLWGFSLSLLSHSLGFGSTLTALDVAREFYINTNSREPVHYNKWASFFTQIFIQRLKLWINCTKFTDSNGKIYINWIPAIRLWT